MGIYVGICTWVCTYSFCQAVLAVIVNPHIFLRKTNTSFLNGTHGLQTPAPAILQLFNVHNPHWLHCHFCIVYLEWEEVIPIKANHRCLSCGHAEHVYPLTPSSQWITSKKHIPPTWERCMTCKKKKALGQPQLLRSLSIPWTETYSFVFSPAALYLKHVTVRKVPAVAVPVLPVWENTMGFPSECYNLT